MENIAQSRPSQRCRVAFPLQWMHGTKDSATVYFELEPKEEVGSHTDSAEEILLVLEGSVEATVGEETVHAEKGQLVLVPKMVPHNVKNTGSSTARIFGFFGGANSIVATFDHGWGPEGERIFDTAALVAS
ncbi:cupin domain-containing protein [Flammeovirgaceae bacterium 311]|nr:cupin domain-containing protein [Flammeovirgaceae bacterium 311]